MRDGMLRHCYCLTWTPCSTRACVDGSVRVRVTVRLVPSLDPAHGNICSALRGWRHSILRPSLPSLRPSLDRCRRIYHSFPPSLLCGLRRRGGSNTFPPSRFLTSRSLDLYNVTRWSGDRLHVKDIAHWEHAICEVGVGVAFSEYGQLVTIRQILDYSVRKNKMRPALINGVNTSR